MIFQIAAAPAYAIGLPDAPNVVSWGLSASLLWFAWRVMRANDKPAGWSAVWVAALGVGIYTVVWHVTGGAHAMGDLAMASAIVALCSRARMLASLRPKDFAALLSILLVSAAASKVSLLPLCAVFTCIVGGLLLRSTSAAESAVVILALVLPWVVFQGPIAVWTWAQSGSPFGPFAFGVFSSSIYSEAWQLQNFLDTRAVNQQFLELVETAAVEFTPLVWLGVVGALWATDLSMATRWILAGLFTLQSVLIYWLLPHDVRFLGGLHYGLLIVFGAFATFKVQARLAPARSLIFACAIFLLPWFGIQFYYAATFFRVALGLETTAFYERYVAFYADYLELDRLLAKDAVLLVGGFRIPAAYAPRPVFFHPADVPPGRPVALFTSPEEGCGAGASCGASKVGELIYQNDHAVVAAYRRPGNPPAIGALQVNRLVAE